MSGARRFVAIFLLVSSFIVLWVFLSSHPTTSQASPPLAVIPGITLDIPNEVFIGDTFTFTVAFDNLHATDSGYSPFIDLIFPVNGADGAAGTDTPDGIDFVSAEYLGAPVTTVERTFPNAGAGTGCVDHPYAVDNTHTPIQVCGTAGDKLVSIQLPFGSFTPDQPPAEVTVTAQVSNLADLGTALPIRARGGFEFGNDALDNWCCDPVILSQPNPDSVTWTPSDTVTPQLLILSKSNDGPEDETATGPNFPRQYTVTVEVANGQTISNVTLTDYLDNNIVITGVSPAGLVVSLGGAAPAYPFGPANAPANELVVNLPSVTGTGSLVHRILFLCGAEQRSGQSRSRPDDGR